MRNGVLAITRDGNVAEINGEAARIFQIKRSPHDRRPALLESAGEASRHGARAAQRVRAEPPAQPRRAAAEDHRQGDRLHAVARARRARPLDRRRAVLQGPHEGRAARRARAPARPARGARRDGRRHRARSEEPARGHRSDGGPAEAPGLRGRLSGRAVAAERHHQRSEDGESDRPRGARVRAADPAAGRAHRDCRRAAERRQRWPKRKCRAARSACRFAWTRGCRRFRATIISSASSSPTC